MLFSEKSSNFACREGEDSPTQSLTYRDMNTENIENEIVSRFVRTMRILHENWKQVIEDGCNTECTIEQAKAYYIASGVIDKIENELRQLLVYDDIDPVTTIKFDEKGNLI